MPPETGPNETVDTMLDAAEFFRVGKKEANEGLGRIRSAVGGWRDVATRLGLPRHEQEQMAVCFERE